MPRHRHIEENAIPTAPSSLNELTRSAFGKARLSIVGVVDEQALVLGEAVPPGGGAFKKERDDKLIAAAHRHVREKIEQFALGLHDLGIRHGDRVALHAENSTEWLIVDQAVLRLGAVTVPIYTTQPADQVRYILEDSEARVYVVSTEALFAPLKAHLAEIATLETTVGILGTYQDAMLPFDEVIEADVAQSPHAMESRMTIWLCRGLKRPIDDIWREYKSFV